MSLMSGALIEHRRDYKTAENTFLNRCFVFFPLPPRWFIQTFTQTINRHSMTSLDNANGHECPRIFTNEDLWTGETFAGCRVQKTFR